MKAKSKIKLINRYNPTKTGMIPTGRVDKNKQPTYKEGDVDRLFCDIGEILEVITENPEEANVAIICMNKEGERFSILFKDIELL